MLKIPWSDGSGRLAYWWMRPAKQGKCLLLGPIQINWYDGLCVHATWPVHKTIRLGERN